MAHSYLVFDFGRDEETAQQARHKIEAWKQGFRLGNKMLLKFERVEPDEQEGAAKPSAAKKKSPAKTDKADSGSNIRVLVRLDFSDPEKLSQQRWLDSIPTEYPHESFGCKHLRPPQTQFDQPADLFEYLD